MVDFNSSRGRLPRWMKVKLPKGENYSIVKNILQKQGLHTICVSGNCPNKGECWSAGTATFMILGDICTRSCRFCGVTSGHPMPEDKDEPLRLAETVQSLKLKHCVITSVTRDDLEDKGSGFWAETIRTVKKINPQTTIEALIPDFGGVEENIHCVVEAKPTIISHNMETVRRLTPLIRSRAEYETSLKVIRCISMSGIISKSGIMLGLGETEEEVLQTMDELLEAGCMVITIGQYLAPTEKHIPVTEYIPPEKFSEYKAVGLKKGFRIVESSPLVRSSYHSERHVVFGC